MKEVFEALPRKSLDEAKDMVLLDTCFIIHTFEHQKDSQLAELVEKFDVAMTTFNAQEFLLKDKVVDDKVREHLRKFLKKYTITLVNTDVHPGDRDGEKRFINAIDPTLLAQVPDVSDAVLIAAAIKTHSAVLTKDKHHLFTVKLENYLKKYDLKVYKEYHDFLK
ncbi:MAG TPA: PIN domain-containing protein [Alphaproteobacteria bacterium]|nr:PIN domain-containing protein [Alphaproteobacteria bacterium]